MLANCSQPKAKRADEYLLQEWYDKNWDGILRYDGDKKKEVRETISQVAILATKNNHIGYSQNTRLTYIENLKKANYNPSKIKKNCEADCSSSTAATVIAAGNLCNVSKLKKVDKGISSSSIVLELKKAGFKYLTDKKYRNGEKNLVVGDILVKAGKHVTIYVGNGKINSSSSSVTKVDKPNFWKQSDKRWGSKKVGSMTCYTGGCGPTSVANVVGALINEKYNPGVVFDYFKEKGYIIAGQGSTRQGITKALEHYGIKAKHIKYSDSNWDKAVTAASSGKWVLSLMSGPSEWAHGSGHYVVIYKSDGKKVSVSDPSDRDLKSATVSSYKSHMKSYWIIDVSNYGGTVGREDDSGAEDGGGTINLQQAIAKLYTSNNYEFVTSGEKTESKFQTYFKSAVIATANKIKENEGKQYTPPSDTAISDAIENIMSGIKSSILDLLTPSERKLVKGNLASYPNLVEAPFIEVDMNGITIGGYNHQEDKYPNNLVSLDIEKVNGRINNYTINIIHQVRAGEDPNFIDSLLSRTGIRNKIKIKYGDSAYGAFFREDEAYIIDVTYTEDVVGAKISYVIKAVSSVGAIQEAYFNFPGINSKPSTEIINMLYNNKNTSTQLLALLGGMQNKTEVLSRGYIPTDDAEMYIPGGENMSLIERLNQLVSYMYDPIDSTASYFLSYQDGGQNNAFFKITKVKKTGKGIDAIKNCYYLDVGYPGNSFVTNFTLDNDVYWPIYFDYAGRFSSYNYDIDYSGKLIETEVNPLTISDRYNSPDVRKMNWWNLVKSYPISASVTIKGLMKPVILMENVYVYAQFYGQEDMASGLYSIIGQKDSISGGGYNTTLQLLRVQN